MPKDPNIPLTNEEKKAYLERLDVALRETRLTERRQEIIQLTQDLLNAVGGIDPVWGCVTIRRAHRHDPEDAQRAGWVVARQFDRPVSWPALQRHMTLMDSPGAWTEPYQIYPVLWQQQTILANRLRVKCGMEPVGPFADEPTI